MNNELIKVVSAITSLNLPEETSSEEAEKILAGHINNLILHDFSRLVAVLYRVDVSEKKLKDLLRLHSETDAGLIIARMIIERQGQKIESRKNFKTDDSADEEKW